MNSNLVNNMEWYRVFYFTAKSGSLSKAAEELFITQPAVSYTLKQLEEKLGSQLFFRTSRGVRLTEEGEVLFKYIEQAYNFIVNGERKLAEIHQLMDGSIKIGAGDTLCRHYLLPHLKTFHEAYPYIKIQVTNRTSQETINLLKEGKIDMGIVNLPVSEDSLNVREGIEIEDCFVAGVKYKKLSERSITLEELLKHPLILLEKGSSTRAYVDRFAGSQGLRIKPEIELGSIDLLVEFAQNGLGIACVIKDFVAQQLAENTLFQIQLTPSIPPRKVGIITLKNVPTSSAASTFIQLLLPKSD